MIKQIIRFALLSFFLSLSLCNYAQIRREKKADQDFERLAFVDAIKIYEQIADKGYVNTVILQNLADSYYFNGNLIQAYKWYSLLFEGTYPDKEIASLASEYYYRYAQTLKAVENFSKAQEYMDAFANMEQQDTRTLLYKQNPNYLEELQNKEEFYKIALLDINSDYSDYGGVIFGKQLIFTSTRATNTKNGGLIDPWTNQSYNSLYSSLINQDGFSEPELFVSDLESQVNDASAVFTSDNKTMYFTRNNSKTNGRGKANKHHESVLKIYKVSKQSDGKWGQIQELPINSDDFNTAHPALTPDGKWLYFSSDRKGTVGQSDIFRVPIYDAEVYGQVENLGPIINTEGRENFPFISSDYKLYFSSDGHPGFGGLDVFMCQLYSDGTIGKVNNLGTPINSSLDDFSFYLDESLKKGFVSSNRLEGRGSDNIYFIEQKPCKQVVYGEVFDKDTKDALANVRVIVSNDLQQNIDTIYTNSSGSFETKSLNCDHKYRYRVELEKYATTEVLFTVQEKLKDKIFSIAMEKNQIQISLEDDLFTKLKLKPILFDFDSSAIDRQASMELIKIVEVMKAHPSLTIDIRSHTDSRGQAKYNMNLSQQRANSTRDWIIAQGIDPRRLTARGFGATQLINQCDKTQNCSEQDHQENRRSEFIISNM
ncbi:OmpA family protein [Myroides sp. LJL116]